MYFGFIRFTWPLRGCMTCDIIDFFLSLVHSDYPSLISNDIWTSLVIFLYLTVSRLFVVVDWLFLFFIHFLLHIRVHHFWNFVLLLIWRCIYHHQLLIIIVDNRIVFILFSTRRWVVIARWSGWLTLLITSRFLFLINILVRNILWMLWLLFNMLFLFANIFFGSLLWIFRLNSLSSSCSDRWPLAYFRLILSITDSDTWLFGVLPRTKGVKHQILFNFDCILFKSPSIPVVILVFLVLRWSLSPWTSDY